MGCQDTSLLQVFLLYREITVLSKCPVICLCKCLHRTRAHQTDRVIETQCKMEIDSSIDQFVNPSTDDHSVNQSIDHSINLLVNFVLDLKKQSVKEFKSLRITNQKKVLLNLTFHGSTDSLINDLNI